MPPNEPLVLLVAAFDEAKREQSAAQAALDAAEERANGIRDQIKAIVTSRFTRPAPPDPRADPATFVPAKVPFERYELRHPALEKPFVLRWQVTHRVDTKRLKAELPDIHARYAPGVGGWVLERKRGA
jgi:hypothetical protein